MDLREGMGLVSSEDYLVGLGFGAGGGAHDIGAVSEAGGDVTG